MTPATTLPCDLHEVADGVLVIPHIYPMHVPAGALELTVREWLGVAALAQPAEQA